MSPPTTAESPDPERERILVACLAEPKNGKRPSLGVVVLGTGMADHLATRRFAHHGWVAMQIRLIRETAVHTDLRRRFNIYDESGVSRCREAMNLLARTYGVQRFILMGSCALANICFNTGVADPRVAGLVLANPHVSNPLTERFWFRVRRHLFHRRSWRRLIGGQMHLLKPAAQVDRIEWTFKGDILLPTDFDRQLRQLLSTRPVRMLLVISEADPALYYFRRHYRRTLDALSAGPQLRFEVPKAHTHDFSASDSSIHELNEVITDWVTKSWAHEISQASECGYVSHSSRKLPEQGLVSNLESQM